MKKANIGILTFPISKAGNIPLSNLVEILNPLSNDLYLVTGNDGYVFFKEDERIQKTKDSAAAQTRGASDAKNQRQH